jgi:hypothetical protein
MALSVDSHGPIFEAAAREWNVDPRLLRAVATQESGGDPNRRSRAGAVGVMQLMPGTAKDLGVTDLTNAEQSIYGGAKYLSQMLDRYKRPELALAAYNAGPGRVDAFLKGGALPDETLKYVPAVKAHFERLGPVADRRASGVMSDDDFLKAIGGAAKPATTAPGATISDDDFLKAIAPTTEAKPAPTDKRQQGNPDNPVMPQRFQKRADLGPRSAPAVETGTTVGDIANSAGNIGSAAAQGFREGSQPMPPLVTPVMEGLGVYPPAAGGGTLLQRANKLVMDPLAAGGELALRLAGGLFRGAQAGVAQAGIEGGDAPMFGVLGSPQQLGRDIAAGPEAFMGALPGGAPRQPNRLAPAAPEYVPLPDKPRIYMRADSAPANPAPEFMPPSVQRPPAAPGSPVAAPEFLPPGATMAPAADDAAMGGRRSAGAAAATDAEAQMSRKEMVTQRATSERTLLEESQPKGADANEYVPGSIPTEAQIAQTTEAARAEKSMGTQSSAAKQAFDDLRDRNNQARVDFYDEVQGTPTLRLRLEEARNQQYEAEVGRAMRNKSATNAQPVVDLTQTILDGPAGRQEAVEKTLKNVIARMKDKDGNLYTDPEMLAGVRNHIRNLLEGKTEDSAQAGLARKQLIQVREELDKAIELGAPGFGQAVKNFANASGPIDEMKLLQEWSAKIRSNNGNGPITFQGVQRMLKDIVSSRESTLPDLAHGITEETMAKLWALRNDLRREHASNTMARAAGSDTGQNFFDAAKGLGARAAGEGAAAAVGIPPGVASMIWGTLTGPMREGALVRNANRATSVEPNRLRPPPQ